ncbi:hypothetical protein F5883DRAFT_212392 [Diaporthe sp. PMI_573]|nr:hypothetical protein F5883DRAFT_212392 [Diaporthaceae sp. PMI_573]
MWWLMTMLVPLAATYSTILRPTHGALTTAWKRQFELDGCCNFQAYLSRQLGKAHTARRSSTTHSQLKLCMAFDLLIARYLRDSQGSKGFLRAVLIASRFARKYKSATLLIDCRWRWKPRAAILRAHLDYKLDGW